MLYHFQLSLSLNDNDSTFQRILKSPVDMTIHKNHVVWQLVNEIQATLQITGQAVTKNGLLKGI